MFRKVWVMRNSILSALVIICALVLFDVRGVAGDNDSFAGTKIGRWREIAPDVVLVLKSTSYITADGKDGYSDISSSSSLVERMADDRFTHYSATPIAGFFNSSVPGSGFSWVDDASPTSYAFVRDNRTQKIVASDRDSVFVAAANACIDALPRTDNPTRGMWVDAVVPVSATAPYFPEPFSVYFTCDERMIEGQAYLLASYQTERFEQALPGGFIFSGRIGGVSLERGTKDKSPLLATRVTGVILGPDRNKEGVVELRSYSIRQGDDLAAFQVLVQDDAAALAMAEELFAVPPDGVEDAVKFMAHPDVLPLAACPSWSDVLLEAIEMRHACLLIQLEMRTNSGFADALVGYGKSIGSATAAARKLVDKLPVPKGFKFPLKVFTLTVDTLLGPCTEALGHVLNGDWDAVNATVTQAYIGTKEKPGFFMQLSDAFIDEVAGLVVAEIQAGIAASDSSYPDWASPLARLSGKLWEKIDPLVRNEIYSAANRPSGQGQRRPDLPIHLRPGSGYIESEEEGTIWEPDPDVSLPAPAAPVQEMRTEIPPAPPPAPIPPIPDTDSRGGLEGIWRASNEREPIEYVVAFDKYVNELFVTKIGPVKKPTHISKRLPPLRRDGEYWKFIAVWDGETAPSELRGAGPDIFICVAESGQSEWQRENLASGVYELVASELVRHRCLERQVSARTDDEKRKRTREYEEAVRVMRECLKKLNGADKQTATQLNRVFTNLGSP